MSYLHNYLQRKSWYDLDFRLFDSKLARLQLRCTCRSGAQSPSCCAHGNSPIWVTFFVLFSNVQENLKQTTRDKKIKESMIVDLTPWSVYQSGRKENSEHWCFCNQDKPDEPWDQCDKCFKWYHPNCCATALANIEKNQ